MCTHSVDLGSEGDEPIPLPNITGVILGKVEITRLLMFNIVFPIKVIAWAEQHASQTTPLVVEPPQPGVELVPHQPVVQARVPQRRGLMPDVEVIPTTWEQNFLDRNKDTLYNILLVRSIISYDSVL